MSNTKPVLTRIAYGKWPGDHCTRVYLTRISDGPTILGYWWCWEHETVMSSAILPWPLTMDWPIVTQEQDGTYSLGWAPIDVILPAATDAEREFLMMAKLVIVS